jgi:hypothetical protein
MGSADASIVVAIGWPSNVPIATDDTEPHRKP